MLTLVSSLARIRPSFSGENRDLLRVLLNATSAAEANLALQVLAPTVPEKTLVAACNLREVLRSLPVSPFPMCVDERSLAGIAGLHRRTATLAKELPDGIELVVTTAGNLVLDLIIKDDTTKHYWTPVPIGEDFINPDLVDLVVASDHLIDGVIELVKCMGLVFNPKFYLSVYDFTFEYAFDTLTGLEDLF